MSLPFSRMTHTHPSCEILRNRGSAISPGIFHQQKYNNNAPFRVLLFQTCSRSCRPPHPTPPPLPSLREVRRSSRSSQSLIALRPPPSPVIYSLLPRPRTSNWKCQVFAPEGFYTCVCEGVWAVCIGTATCPIAPTPPVATTLRSAPISIFSLFLLLYWHTSFYHLSFPPFTQRTEERPVLSVWIRPNVFYGLGFASKWHTQVT